MQGVKAGETREGDGQDLSDDAPNEALRGQEITAVFEVLEVKKLELPEADRRVAAKRWAVSTTKASCATRSARNWSGSWNTTSSSEAREQITASLTDGRRLGPAARAAPPPERAANWSGP